MLFMKSPRSYNIGHFRRKEDVISCKTTSDYNYISIGKSSARIWSNKSVQTDNAVDQYVDADAVDT